MSENSLRRVSGYKNERIERGDAKRCDPVWSARVVLAFIASVVNAIATAVQLRPSVHLVHGCCRPSGDAVRGPRILVAVVTSYNECGCIMSENSPLLTHIKFLNRVILCRGVSCMVVYLRSETCLFAVYYCRRILTC